MTPERIKLIKLSFAPIIARKREAGQLFYQRLFEMAPDLRAMFKTDMNAQAEKLMSTFGAMVGCLQEGLDRTVRHGRKHDARERRQGRLISRTDLAHGHSLNSPDGQRFAVAKSNPCSRNLATWPYRSCFRATTLSWPSKPTAGMGHEAMLAFTQLPDTIEPPGGMTAGARGNVARRHRQRVLQCRLSAIPCRECSKRHVRGD
jgi:hypothetical protein